MGLYIHCRCIYSQIFQSNLSLKDFQSLISARFCPYVFKMALQHLQVHLNHTARHGAKVPALTGSGEVLLSQCSLAPAWIPCANEELLIAAPHHASRGSAAPSLGEELRSAQQSYTLGRSALAQGIHTTYGVWQMHARTHTGLGFYLGLLLGGVKGEVGFDGGFFGFVWVFLSFPSCSHRVLNKSNYSHLQHH